MCVQRVVKWCTIGVICCGDSSPISSVINAPSSRQQQHHTHISRAIMESGYPVNINPVLIRDR